MSLPMYRNLLEILRSINIVESYVQLPFCLGPRMLHEAGQNKVPREYIEKRLTGVYDCHFTWLTTHLPNVAWVSLQRMLWGCIEITEFSLSSGCA